MNRQHKIVLLCVLPFTLWLAQERSLGQVSVGRTEVIVVDAHAPARPFPHFWEHMFGSGRASLTLRESYQRDLRDVKRITDVEYVRFHAIFLDDMGVYDEDAQGNPVYNFSYVTKWEDKANAPDNDGYAVAKEKLDKAYKDAERTIKIKSPETGLDALVTFEGTTFH